jgi:hypothetical protein
MTDPSDHIPLEDCVFTGVIREVTFAGRSDAISGPDDPARLRNEFRGNDFSEARLDGVAFGYGIDLRAQRLPRDRRYVFVGDAPSRLLEARKAIRRWEELEERRDALEMLDFISIGGGAEEQEDLFKERDHPSFIPESVRQRVWALLEACGFPGEELAAWR